jgi:hypothetical protein
MSPPRRRADEWQVTSGSAVAGVDLILHSNLPSSFWQPAAESLPGSMHESV